MPGFYRSERLLEIQCYTVTEMLIMLLHTSLVIGELLDPNTQPPLVGPSVLGALDSQPRGNTFASRGGVVRCWSVGWLRYMPNTDPNLIDCSYRNTMKIETSQKRIRKLNKGSQERRVKVLAVHSLSCPHAKKLPMKRLGDNIYTSEGLGHIILYSQ